MHRNIEIFSEKSIDDLKTRLNTLTEKPKIKLFGFDSRKMDYSGEISETEFWFSWSKQMKILKYGNPIVKGKLERNENGTRIQLTVKENSIYVLSTFALIILITLAFFSIELTKENDKGNLIIVVFLVIITLSLIGLNTWKVKRGMKKMTEELKYIFDDTKTNNC